MLKAEDIRKLMPTGFLVGLCIYAALITLLFMFGFIVKPSSELVFRYFNEIGEYLYPNQIVNQITGLPEMESDRIALYAVIGFWFFYMAARVASTNDRKWISVTGAMVSAFLAFTWCLSICLLWILAGLKT